MIPATVALVWPLPPVIWPLDPPCLTSRRVGAVATQAHTNPYLGICGLERLEQSSDAESVLASLLADDQHRDRRQFHLIDLDGRTACWTGQDCGPWAGHRHQRDLSVAGNCLVDEGVLVAMEQAFLTSDPSLKLGRRLMMALQAGEAAGGDQRSPFCTSAAVQVSGEAAFPLLDLRVDFHERAVEQLMEVYERSQALWAQEWRDDCRNCRCSTAWWLEPAASLTPLKKPCNTAVCRAFSGIQFRLVQLGTDASHSTFRPA